MSPSSAPIAMLDLPPVAGQSALRAGLTALGVDISALPIEGDSLKSVLRRLADQAGAVAFVDISRASATAAPTLLELDAMLPRDGARERVFLTRLLGGHVSVADRRWARSLGFADLLPEFDARDCEGSLRRALDGVARVLDQTPLEPAQLARHARVLNQEREVGTPRATLRALTGKSAEEVAETLRRSLAIRDRPYRLQTYAECFVGSEAVSWMSRRWHRSAAEAVAIGQALGSLGLLVHVTHDHPFLDDHLFYRLAVSQREEALDLDAVFTAMQGRDGVAIADRSYLAKTYEACWVGSEAVDFLCARFQSSRHEAWLALHRLMQFGLIEHVVQARPFIDGTFFYRFAGLPADRRE